MTWFPLNNLYNHIINTPTVNLFSERMQIMKHLVVQFDRSLVFTEHVDQVVIRNRKEVADIIRVMAAEKM